MYLLGKIKQFEGVHELRVYPFKIGTVYMYIVEIGIKNLTFALG